MNQNFGFEPKKEHNKAKSNFNRSHISRQKALSNIAKHFHPLEKKSTNLFLDFAETEGILNAGNARIETEPKEVILQKPQKNFNVKLIAALASAIVMLPILAIGTTSYYFGSQAINKQTALARRTDNTGISETELAKQRQLLANLLIGTGATALLTGLLAAFLANRTLSSMKMLNTVVVKAKDEVKPSKPEKSSLAQFIGYLNHAVDRDNMLAATVEEAQRLLECDRVVIYGFDRHNYSKVIAEAVNPGWTKALDIIISDSCLEANHREKYCEGWIKVLDNIYESGLEPCYIKQLEKLEIKAIVVIPIIARDKLLGLLSAHQCSSSRIWQLDEVELLTGFAQRISFILNDATLLAESKLPQEQTAIETQWTKFFTDAVKYIRQSLQEQDILQASVEEVRRVLDCDRVVIYSLNRDNHGVVIAESVAPGWTKALGIAIKDPCFEARYMKEYENGRVRALNNIYEAGITPCYLEQLEKLEVKANLVTPIINEGKLFGLLVSHQCSHPRNWQQQEIIWVTQIAMQVGFALDNAKLNTKLLAESSQLKQQQEIETQWTRFFTDAVKHIRQSLKQEDILQVSVEEVRRVLNCDRVVIYSLNRDNHGVVIAESIAPGWTRAIGITIKDPCFEAKYMQEYENGRVRALDNVYEAGITSCYLEQLEKLEVKANLVTPVINEDKLFGLLVAHQCSHPRNWQQHEINWVTQIATQVGFALDNAKLLAESSQIKQQAEVETQWTQFFTNAVRHIRQSLKQEDILDITVKEVRQVLDCDRVVIYSLNRDNHGVVIAESVAPGSTRALGIAIEDPCFEAKYMQEYENGRVRALDNIYKAGITPCYLEQLEKLEVKANLVTPVINEDKLFGLLVAHQCAHPRTWQQHEIRWVTQIATQVGFALDNAKLLRQLENNNLPSQSPDNFILPEDLETLTPKNLSLEKTSLEQDSFTKIPIPKASQLLLDTKKAFENLWLEATHQSETITQFLVQMQTISDFAQEIANIEPNSLSPSAIASLQFEQTQQAEINEISFRINLTKVEEKISQAIPEIQQINHSAQKISQIGSVIDSLRQRLEEQATDVSIQADRLESNQSSLVSIAERVAPLTTRLTTQARQIETLIKEISIETKEVIDLLDFNTRDIFAEITLEPENQPLLQHDTEVNAKVQNFTGKIDRVIEKTQNLAFVNQFILQIATSASQGLTTISDY